MKVLKFSVWLYAIVLLASAGVHSSSAAILYSQASYPNPAGGATSNFPVPISADDFTPDQPWLVSSATFKGGWQSAGVPVPLSGGTLPIRVGFYADAAGKPAEPAIYSTDVVAVFGPGQALPGGLTYFDFTLNLPAPVYFNAGQHYWFSAADPATRASFKMFWAFSPEGNGHNSQTDGFRVWQSYGLDLTFSLQGEVVPEPGLASMLIGILALAGIGRRGRRPALQTG